MGLGEVGADDAAELDLAGEGSGEGGVGGGAAEEFVVDLGGSVDGIESESTGDENGHGG